MLQLYLLSKCNTCCVRDLGHEHTSTATVPEQLHPYNKKSLIPIFIFVALPRHLNYVLKMFHVVLMILPAQFKVYSDLEPKPASRRPPSSSSVIQVIHMLWMILLSCELAYSRWKCDYRLLNNEN